MKNFQEAAQRLEEDYRIFLDYLENNDVRLSKTTEHIGKNDCYALNQQFHIVNENYAGAGRTQEYYTVIDFFIYFSVYTHILYKVTEKGGVLRLKRGSEYEKFLKLSSLKKYALMMEAWLDGYWIALEESGTSHSDFGFFRCFKETKIGTPIFSSREESLWGITYIPQIRLCALFGLITIDWVDETEEADKENIFKIKAIWPTEEGICVMGKLYQGEADFWLSPDWKRTFKVLKLILPQETKKGIEELLMFGFEKKEAGLHSIEFTIKLGRAVRKIKMGDQNTLEELHYAILRSVGFDTDHLYFFQFHSGTMMKRYFPPECSENGMPTDEILLADLSLYKGMKFVYLYDFGDEWRFQITVECICEEHMAGSEITAVKGENPVQYAYEDEEDWI